MSKDAYYQGYAARPWVGTSREERSMKTEYRTHQGKGIQITRTREGYIVKVTSGMKSIETTRPTYERAVECAKFYAENM